MSTYSDRPIRGVEAALRSDSSALVSRCFSAIEKDQHACATYRANHPTVRLLEQDITKVSGDDLLLKNDTLDLLAGCPPCQGYTSLNKNGLDDPRNELIFQIARLAEQLKPRAIMMENVPGLTSKGKDLYADLKADLDRLGYQFANSARVLQAADYGVPQERRRLVILAGLGFDISLPRPTHSKNGDGGLSCWRSVADAIGGKKYIGDPLTLSQAKGQGDLRRSDWHVVRDLSEQNKQRMAAAVPGRSWVNIPEHLRPDCHRGAYLGFTNVYGRMEWRHPSPTITGGCTTFSKGRFGHPVKNRTISVREAALLQTFPRDYCFDVPYMDHVCNVIGNALPCDFAAALAKQCYDALCAQVIEADR